MDSGYFKKREKKNSFQSRSESFCRPTLFSPPFGRVAFESSVIKLLNWSINHQKLGGGVKKGELSATTSSGFTPNMAVKLKTRSWAQSRSEQQSCCVSNLLSESSCLENSKEKEMEQKVKPPPLLLLPADITSL